MSYSIDRLQTIVIGRRLDGGVDTVEFDCHGWLKRYPELTDYRVEVTNPAGDAYHPEKVEMQDGRLIWTIMPSDTAIEGEGMYQIVATGKNGERKTSANCATIIKNIMPGAPSGAPPEAAQTWLDQAINAARRAVEAAANAEDIGTLSKDVETLKKYNADYAKYVMDQFHNMSDMIKEARNEMRTATEKKLNKNQGTENVGKLMYVSANGALVPLALGAGLEIRDGVLVVTATGTVAAEITVDENGNAIVTGATLTVDEAGNATFTGAVLTVDEAGNATLK